MSVERIEKKCEMKSCYESKRFDDERQRKRDREREEWHHVVLRNN